MSEILETENECPTIKIIEHEFTCPKHGHQGKDFAMRFVENFQANKE